MKQVLQFFKHQKLFILLQVSLIVLPFILISLYLPKIPLMPYFFLLILVVLKLVIFSEKKLEHKLSPIVRANMEKKLGKPPGQNQVFLEVLSHIQARNISMGITAVLIVSLGIIFDKF